MARLLITTDGFEDRLIELRLGANRIGRNPANDFAIQHPTVSNLHCEIHLAEGGVTVRDLESTNGTFVNDTPIREQRVEVGQIVRIGDVELLVENTDARVAIPKFVNPELPPRRIVTATGASLCMRHPESTVTHLCTVCKEVMCDACVHRLQRRSGKIVLLLCPICSGPVELISAPPKGKKKSWLSRTAETVRLKLSRAIKTGR